MSGRKTLCFVTGNAGKLREVQNFLQPSPGEEGAGDAFPYTLEAVKVDLRELQSDTAEHISCVKALEAFGVVNGISADAATQTSAAEGADGGGAECLQLECTLPSSSPQRTLRPVLVDDTSLSFAALGDMPGPYIKHFLQALGPANLVKMVKGFAPPSTDGGDAGAAVASSLGYRRATATSLFTLAYVAAQDASAEAKGMTRYVVRTRQFAGHSPGCLVDVPRGASGFGWDSVFAPLVNPSNYADNKAALEAYAKDPKTGRFPPPSSTAGFVVDERAFQLTYAELSHEEKNLVSHRAVALRKLKEGLSQ